MASNDRVSSQQIKEYQEAFRLFDKNKDNRICVRELQNVMNVLGQYPSEAELKALIKGIDTDGNGTIEFNEFLAMMNRTVKHVNVEQEMRQAFKVFDRDKNGYISREELRSAMHDLGERLTDKQLQDMMDAADVNRDGVIDYKEFVRMMMLEMKK